MQQKLKHPALGAVIFIAYVAVVVWVSKYSYRWIETPARSWFNGIAARWRAPAVGLRPGAAG